MRSFRRKLAGLRPGGFTLVELAVVSAILAGLAVAVVTYVGSTSQTVDGAMDSTVGELRTGADTSGLGDYGPAAPSAFVEPTYLNFYFAARSAGVWNVGVNGNDGNIPGSEGCGPRPFLVSINGAAFVEATATHNNVELACDLDLGSLGAVPGDQVQIGFDYYSTSVTYDSPGNYLYSPILTLS
jgi:prepilin-type N-terminal cleavage/methylation domain-containing protein